MKESPPTFHDGEPPTIPYGDDEDAVELPIAQEEEEWEKNACYTKEGVHAGVCMRAMGVDTPDAVVRQRILFWFPLLFLVGERSPACYFALLASISSSVTLASSK